MALLRAIFVRRTSADCAKMGGRRRINQRLLRTTGTPMAGNGTLSARNRAALDEWYTQLTDIEAELRHYRDQFKGKLVLCNCDDPYESNFFKYFAMNFNHLGLKRLITTCYSGSPISGKQLPLLETAGLRNIQPPREAYKVVISEVPDLNHDGADFFVAQYRDWETKQQGKAL